MDNVETKKLLPILKKFAQECLDDLLAEPSYTSIEEIEFKRRDGFTPYSHNKGGIDLIAVINPNSVLGSGFGGPKAVRLSYEAQTRVLEYIQAEHPTLVDGVDEFYEVLDECLNNEYEEFAYRVRLKYEGNNTLGVFVGYDTDAPYFRFKCKDQQEFFIKFKDKKDLRNQLNKLIKEFKQ